jgi:hypothetical protein
MPPRIKVLDPVQQSEHANQSNDVLILIAKAMEKLMDRQTLREGGGTVGECETKRRRRGVKSQRRRKCIILFLLKAITLFARGQKQAGRERSRECVERGTRTGRGVDTRLLLFIKKAKSSSRSRQSPCCRDTTRINSLALSLSLSLSLSLATPENNNVDGRTPEP